MTFSLGKGGRSLWAMLSLVCLSAPALAADVLITAEFDSTLEGFKHTTPKAWYCTPFPHGCLAGFFSTNVPITYRKGTEHSALDVRDQFFLALPAAVTVQVRNQAGDAHDIVFAFAAVGHRTHTSDVGPPNTTPQRPCVALGFRYSTNFAEAAWRLRTPASPFACYSSSNQGRPGDLRSSRVSKFAIGYTLTTPSPMRMKNGLYTGEVTFTVGNGGQIDLGNQVSELSDDTLTLKFRLQVKHAFIVETPPGSDLAVLEPEGGWLNWTSSPQAPPRIYRDHPLRLWSAGPFKVHTQCEFPAGGQCAIRNPGDGHQVPFEVALTMPGGGEHNGAPARRVALPVGALNALEFDAQLPLFNRPGMLHYQVVQPYVLQMMQRAGARYEGWVRIVFDAQL
jgi:hypothetical protein